MKVKYISDDGHEFTSKTYCEHYENALNQVDNVNQIPYKDINGTRWYRISSVAEFYFFDHMDDTKQERSANSLYDITMIYAGMSHRFPFWITKGLDDIDGVMIDKKRLEMIDGIIEALERDIEGLKEEKENLSELRSMDMSEDEFKEAHADVDPPTPPTGEVRKEGEKPQQNNDDIELKPFMEINGKNYQLQDLMRMTMEDSEFDEDEWAELTNNERDNLIKQKIRELRNK